MKKRIYPRQWVAVILIIMAVTAVAAYLCSCSLAKRAAKHIEKAYKLDPATVAKIARDKFPCTELLKTDTLTEVTDSIIYVDCPDNNGSDYADGQIRHDTLLIRGVSGQIRIPVHIPIQTKTIFKYFEDSAKILLLNSDLKVNGKIIKDLTDGNTKLKSKLNWWRGFAAIGIILLLISAFLNYLQLTRRI